MWPREAKRKYCPNAERVRADSLVGCQNMCEKKTTCVGISYDGFDRPGSCRMCDDDELANGRPAYNFYRRPGSVPYFSLRLINLETLCF